MEQSIILKDLSNYINKGEERGKYAGFPPFFICLFCPLVLAPYCEICPNPSAVLFS